MSVQGSFSKNETASPKLQKYLTSYNSANIYKNMVSFRIIPSNILIQTMTKLTNVLWQNYKFQEPSEDFESLSADFFSRYIFNKLQTIMFNSTNQTFA